MHYRHLYTSSSCEWKVATRFDQEFTHLLPRSAQEYMSTGFPWESLRFYATTRVPGNHKLGKQISITRRNQTRTSIKLDPDSIAALCNIAVMQCAWGQEAIKHKDFYRAVMKHWVYTLVKLPTAPCPGFSSRRWPDWIEIETDDPDTWSDYWDGDYTRSSGRNCQRMARPAPPNGRSTKLAHTEVDVLPQSVQHRIDEAIKETQFLWEQRLNEAFNNEVQSLQTQLDQVKDDVEQIVVFVKDLETVLNNKIERLKSRVVEQDRKLAGVIQRVSR